MLETERSSDEALREPTYRRLYLGALEIENKKRKLRACYIILLAGRLGLRTGEIQHVREEWIDWDRGEIAIPRHDPCGCKNCWLRAKQKAIADEEKAERRFREVVEEEYPNASDEDIEEIIEELSRDEEQLIEDDEENEEENNSDNRTAEEILYEERWKPKYERSARRVPFGHSRRLTAAIMEFIRREEYMPITQPAMMNLVREAAKNANGVDPENITIRGLRATAATHYSTYIRNPKVLQDLMGWTRLETSSRYLRRSGALTTDIVYHAFEKGNIAPAIFPGEPKERYPLIDNPLPYQKEPYDPMIYTKEARQEFGRAQSSKPRKLIHPRSNNHPENIEYNQDNHKIRTHEDYESEIIERDGITIFESPTLADLLDDHQGLSELEADGDKRTYLSIEEWEKQNSRQTELAEITGEEGQYRSEMGDWLKQTLYYIFAGVEQIEGWISTKIENIFGVAIPPKQPDSPVKLAMYVFIMLCIASIMLVFSFVQTGLFDPETMSWNISGPAFLAIVVALYTVYKIPKVDSLKEIWE